MNIFYGLPWPIQALFITALTLTIIQLFLVILLSFKGAREARRRKGEELVEADFTWVVLVPALNEEVTILDTVSRLRKIKAANREFFIINDGSEDKTGEILSEVEDSELQVITRVAPNAKKGKAAALNDAWERLVQSGRYDPETTLIVVVDADGRLDEDFTQTCGPLFLDGKVGGVQLGVKIYNKQRALTYMQNLEFSVFGNTFQMGRSPWGTAGMGGNGQINRLSALNAVAARNRAHGASAGPWRDRLTEDQDLGISLIMQGWKSQQDMASSVNQQGLPGYRKLVRQRIRWCMGNMQAMSRIWELRKAKIALAPKIDAAYWLCQPVVQTIVGFSTLVAMALLIFRPQQVQPENGYVLFLILLILGFGGTCLALLRTASGVKDTLRALLMIPFYTAYCWILLPIYPVAWWRLARKKKTWAKTEREKIQ